MNERYTALGVSDKVLAFSEDILVGLTDRFADIDGIAEANQLKVIAAMQKNRVAANHFNLSTGYGYDDEGRDTLERVYADCFGAEAALCGRRSPAAPTCWRWRWGRTCCPVTSCSVL